MNYLHQINGFWNVQDEYNLTVTDIAVYFYLLKISNRPGEWVNPFKRINSKIVADLGISKPTLNNSRNKLKKVGLIEFVSISGDANVEYTIVDLQKFFTGKYKGNNIAAVLGSDTSPIGGTYVHNINRKESKLNKNIYRQFGKLAISTDEFDMLVELGSSKEQIDSILDAIENYKENSKYSSLYETAKQWLKRNADKKTPPVAGRKESTAAEKEHKKRVNKTLEAFELYKSKGKYTDWDNLVYNFLDVRGVIPFTNDQKNQFLLQAVARSGLPEQDKQTIAEAKQIALTAYFNEMAEEGKELKNLIK